MNTTLRFTLLTAALLIGLIGCTNSNSKPVSAVSTESVEGTFKVDGTDYGYNGSYAKEETGGKILCSAVIVFPKEQSPCSGLHIIETDGTFRASFWAGEGLDIPQINLSVNRVYLIKEGKSATAQTNEEMNIDLSDPSFLTPQKLVPVLEQFVHENVKKNE